jgi:hypothetical protein
MYNSDSEDEDDAPLPPSHTAGLKGNNLPGTHGSLDASFFPMAPNPKVMIWYSTNSTGPGVGRDWLFALTNALQKDEIPTFNGYMVTGGQNWPEIVYGVLEDCEVLVLMLSKPYFKSHAAMDELQEACKMNKPMITIYLEPVDITQEFLGTSTEQKRTAKFIRPFISGNCIPPDQGLFQGRSAADFERNAATLVRVDALAPAPHRDTPRWHQARGHLDSLTSSVWLPVPALQVKTMKSKYLAATSPSRLAIQTGPTRQPSRGVPQDPKVDVRCSSSFSVTTLEIERMLSNSHTYLSIRATVHSERSEQLSYSCHCRPCL